MTVYKDLKDVPSGRYGIVYADPPWEYSYWRKSGSNGRAAANHYDVRPPERIAEMDVARICMRDTYLLLWVTGPMLYESRKVVEGWGFDYSTIGFGWCKVNADGSPYVGMGYTVRSNLELCLLCRRGQPETHSKKIKQIVEDAEEPEAVKARVGRHSQKPKSVGKRITLLAGDVPRIELFCRGPPLAGWDAMGWEADGGQRTL